MTRTRSLSLFALVAALAVVAAAVLGVPMDADALTLGALLGDPGSIAGLGIAAAAGIGATVTTTQQQTGIPTPRQRIREDLTPFQNVVAGGRAFTTIPRYARSLHRITLRLGGTTLTKAYLTEIRIKIGAKTIFLTTGSDLDKIMKYKGLADDDKQITLDFTQPTDKSRAGELVGGLDLSQVPDGEIRLEVVISSSASAPTLAAKATWGPLQGNALVQQLKQFTWGSGTATGKQQIPLDFGGGMVQRLFIMYTGTDFAASATSSAWSTNTGNGAMGSITVSAAAKLGVYKLVIIEPAVNAGAFVVYDPDGIPLSTKGTVASAFASSMLSFTLADGATDFVAGDGFDITVSSVSDGNVNRVEVKKNGATQWDYSCSDARFMEREFKHVPQSKMYVVDYIADNWSDGILVTADATSLEHNVWLTAADNLTIYAEVLDLPQNA